MRFLFVSEDLIAGNLARLLIDEGHDVKLCILEAGRTRNFENLVPKVDSWESELAWVGKEGVVVFDYVGDGAVQDQLRADGYSVFGGGIHGESLELNRVEAERIFREYGLDEAPLFNFTNIDEAITFVERERGCWVIKKNAVATNSVSYVGKFDDGRDVLDMLRSYKTNNVENTRTLTLQKKIVGVEIAVARYFNGDTWVSPIEINIEHNPFLSGNIGLSTSEMGTIAWHTTDKQNVLFTRTLAKLEPYLRHIQYRGVIDINCIVNETGVYPLEATARFGSPIAHLQSEMLISGWGELITACAKGEPYMSEWKKGNGIVVFVTAPPFPYVKNLPEYNPDGLTIYISDTDAVLPHVHFEDVSLDTVNNNYVISDTRGYILYVTACEETMAEAKRVVYERIEKIYFPKMMYRNDIGTQFIENDQELLQQWGYL